MQIRGGYGCGQVVPLIDFELVAAHPKPFVGMSDITLLHLALGRHAGLVTLWGPNCVQLGRDGSGYSVDRLSRALRGEIAPVGHADGSPPVKILVPGKAEGPLAGGTTTLLAASLGTSYELETKGRVLLLEDVHVEPYEVDRCLTQLLHAGKLDVAAGFAIAEHSDVRTEESFGGHTLELAEVFEDILVPLGRPTVYGLPLGHSPRIATVPLGANVVLDADAGLLTVQ
jgi:muramoyltetrapeptide carboxypeptidase